MAVKRPKRSVPSIRMGRRATSLATPSKGPLQIECVLLRDDKGHSSICISTQVGCAMKCAFCATGLGGMRRNLTTGEILEQMLQLQRLLQPEERLSHIVCMGMGEPLANLDRLMPALAVASAKDGLGIGVRKITISTVGLPVGIRRLAEQNCQYHLAVSLHAPNDALRTQLMPTNRNIGIEAILAAADDYFEKTGRRVTYEYVLLAGVNDGPIEAKQLVDIAPRPAVAGQSDSLQPCPRAEIPHAALQRGGEIRGDSGAGGAERGDPPSQRRADRCGLRAIAAEHGSCRQLTARSFCGPRLSRADFSDLASSSSKSLQQLRVTFQLLGV